MFRILFLNAKPKKMTALADFHDGAAYVFWVTVVCKDQQIFV